MGNICQTANACGSVDAIVPVVSSTFLLSFAVVDFACSYHEIMSPTFSSSFVMVRSRWRVEGWLLWHGERAREDRCAVPRRLHGGK
jgi:hypothetical protein